MIPHADIVGVITPSNILFIGVANFDPFMKIKMVIMMMMIIIIMIMMMMIITIVIVSVEQRPGWGEQVQTIPTTYVVSTNISTMQRHNIIQNIPAYSSTTDLDDMILCICILVGGFNPSEKY